MKTRRVRIKVLVAVDGSYSAGGLGIHHLDDETHLQWVYDMLPDHVGEGEYQVVWVEADVPLPETPLVEGKVVE
jgi:hypothetical protein